MAVPDLAVHRPGPLPGWVYLVGAGPGDPELFTLRGARLVAGADVIVYDNLVAPPILELAPASAERIYVGKKAADHSLPQDEINQLLLKLARENKRVVRLKGGDPFIFGRGGEEMELLVEAGIHVEVVPGVTAAAGVSAYAGIPLTHREHAQSVVFATGFLKEGKIDLDWPMLARATRPTPALDLPLPLPVLPTSTPRRTSAAAILSSTTSFLRAMRALWRVSRSGGWVMSGLSSFVGSEVGARWRACQRRSW